MKCLENIIGITRTPCQCLSDCLPKGYSNSDSGLYIDELSESPISIHQLRGASECKDIGILLNTAKENAIKEFKRELYKQLYARYKTSAKPFSGIIGSLSNNRILELNTNYAGISIQGKLSGASCNIKKINTAFDRTASFDLLIYKRDERIKTIHLQSIVGQIKENTVDIQLPLYDDYGPIAYYLVYQKIGNPKDNTISCNCGGKESMIAQYIDVRGITSDSIGNYAQSGYANGLLIEAELSCNTEDIVCNALNDQFLKVAIEWSILRKAVEILITGVLNSTVINIESLANREQMYYNAQSLSKKFNNDVQWIAENIDLTDNGCFICNSDNEGYRLTGIR